MRTFSEFFEYLGCPLKNIRWSWCGVSPAGDRVLFTLWSDEIKNRKYVLYPITVRRPGYIDEDVDTRNGAEEMQRVAHFAAQNPDVQCFGVLTIAKDTKARPRERATYDDNTLFKIRVAHSDGIYTGELLSRPSVRSVLAGEGAA